MSLWIRITLLLALGLLLLPSPASAQEFVRVEVLVFTHAGERSDAWPEEQLPVLPTAHDPLWNAWQAGLEAAPELWPSAADDPEIAAALRLLEVYADLENEEDEEDPEMLSPPAWLALETLSEPMEAARQRLERSGSVALLTALAWYQPLASSLDDAPVRIHDDRLLRADWIQLAPHGQLQIDGRPVREVKELFPYLHYRLDGSLRIRQRRHLHADVDLRWQESERLLWSYWPLPQDSDRFLVHQLEETRSIRELELEYFDSAWLGVLVRIEPWQPDQEEEILDEGSTP